MNYGQKWAHFLKQKTDNIPATTSDHAKNEIRKIMRQLATDYPHRIIDIIDNGQRIGSRRVFIDNSYADVKLSELQNGRCLIETGLMIGGKNEKPSIQN